MAGRVVVELRCEVERLRSELRTVTEHARQLETRAEIARRDARDAWSFAKALMRAPTAKDKTGQ